MKRVMIRVGLSLMVAAGTWVQRAPAQQPSAGGQPPLLVVQTAQPSAAAQPPLLVVPTPIAPVVPPPVYSTVQPPPPEPHKVYANPLVNSAAKAYYHMADTFHNYGRCCSSDVNNPGCSGLHAELHFIFGSCRYWFGEPCLPTKHAERQEVR